MVKCKACGCNNDDDEIFCTGCGEMIMTSEYLDNIEEENNNKLKFPKELLEIEDEEENAKIAIPKEVIEQKLQEDMAKVKEEKREVTIDGVKYAGVDNGIQEFYMAPEDDDVFRFKKNKKLIIIAAAVAVAVVLLVFAVIGISSIPKSDNGINEVSLPGEELIIKSLSKDENVTVVKINGKNETVEIKEMDIIDTKTDDKNGKYTVKATVTRNNDYYELSPAKYTVVFENKHDVYIYKNAKIDEKYKMILTPISGYSVEEAQKEVEKKYRNVKFKSQKTDLKKGEDRIFFTIKDKTKKGTAVAFYKFNNKKGWEFVKTGMHKVQYKKGVTHKEKGLLTNSGVRNIMFFGVDADTYGGRSDVMMLISIDTNTKKVKMTSFMRDTYVNIPGVGYNKLNAAFALGGAEAAVGAIENTYKMKIDNYVATNFSTFKNIINNLGGVQIKITADEAGYINWQLGRNGQTSVGLVSSGGGNVKLNGQQALWLCRDRGGNGFSGDDFSRTGRQRRVLQSLITSYDHYSPTQVLSTINSLKGNVQTDLTAKDFKWLAENSTEFFKFTVQGRCAPDHGEWHAGTSPGGAWIIQFNDWNKFLKDLQDDIYEDLK